MKAILHIGIEKTGTTTIQAFLDLNRDKLENKGIAYLLSLGRRNNRKLAIYCMNNHIVDGYIRQLGIVSNSQRDKWKAQFKEKFDIEIKNLSQDISKVLISSEHFHSRLRDPDEIKSLYNTLKLYFEEIKVLVYLRRQDRVAVSLFSTKCKVGATNYKIFDDKISTKNSYYNYYDLVEKWASIFGRENILIRIFEREKFVDYDLLEDFSDAIGLSKTQDFKIPKYLNEKLSAQVQSLMILFNDYFSPSINNIPIDFNNRLRSYLIKELSKKYDDAEIMPTRDKAIEFYEKFHKSNNKLANEYLSSDQLFTNDFSMYPEQEESEQRNFKEEIMRDTLDLISKFLDNYLIIPKKKINLNQKSSDILREIALSYKPDSPEMYSFLIKEANRYQSKN